MNVVPVVGPAEVGTNKGKNDGSPLSEMIDLLNERFGTNFTKTDRPYFDQGTEQVMADSEVQQKAGSNLFDNFALSVRDKILDLMIDRMDDNAAIVAMFMNDPEFQQVAFREMAKKIYEGARTGGDTQPGTVVP